MVEEHKELVTEFIEQDPKGYFIIKVDTDRNEIIADHYSNGNILLNRITGNKAKYIHKRVTSLGLISNISHAAYLGHELRAAQFAMEHNLPYEQDREMVLMTKDKLSDVSLAAEATYVKAGKFVSIPGRSHEENVKVGQVEMPFKDFLRSRGLSRVF